jgi:hypothetical protein
MLFVDVESLNQRVASQNDRFARLWKSRKRSNTSQKAPHPTLLPEGEKGP